MSVFSRVAAITGRSLLRASVNKQSALLGLAKPRFIGFTRGVATQSEVRNELIEALENEIKAEQSLESDNLGGSTRPTVPGFQIKTDQAEVRLTKTFGSEKILVVFNVNHSVDVEDDGVDAESGKIFYFIKNKVFVFSSNATCFASILG